MDSFDRSEGQDILAACQKMVFEIPIHLILESGQFNNLNLSAATADNKGSAAIKR